MTQDVLDATLTCSSSADDAAPDDASNSSAMDSAGSVHASDHGSVATLVDRSAAVTLQSLTEAANRDYIEGYLLAEALYEEAEEVGLVDLFEEDDGYEGDVDTAAAAASVMGCVLQRDSLCSVLLRDGLCAAA